MNKCVLQILKFVTATDNQSFLLEKPKCNNRNPRNLKKQKYKIN